MFKELRENLFQMKRKVEEMSFIIMKKSQQLLDLVFSKNVLPVHLIPEM